MILRSKHAALSKLEQESLSAFGFYICFCLLALSGYLTYAIGTLHADWQFANVLGHVVIALFFTPLSIRYLFIHFQRVLGVRKPVSIMLGLMLSLCIASILFSGLYMLLYGLTQTTQWVLRSHIYSAHLAIILFLLHMLFSYFKKHKRLNRLQQEGWKSLSTKHAWISVISIVIYLGFLFVFEGVYSNLNKPLPSSEIGNYDYRYGSNPFSPSQTETPDLAFIPTKKIANSARCGTCHHEIFKQWSSSAHRQSASDPAYVKNIHLLEDSQGISATRYCEGCHAPIALLTGQLTPGGKHGGVKDTPAFNEGVGCMGCHGIDSIVNVEGTASYRFEPANGYLFEYGDSLIEKKIYNFLIRIRPHEHKQQMHKSVLKKPELCATCHEQFMDKSMNHWGWVKLQDVYSDWLSTPFSGHTDQTFNQAKPARCQDCHFPMTPSLDPSTDNNGMVRSHFALGANTMLPWMASDRDHLKRTIEFLKSNRVKVSIDQPTRNDAIQTGQIVDRQLLPNQGDATPHFYYLGEKAEIRVTVSNIGVGHSFPAGTTDINQAWLHFRVTDAHSKVVFESGALDDAGFVDSKAHFYHSVPIDRQGKAVWKHDLFRMIGDSYKNVIPAGESDIVDYQFDIPFWAKSPLTISATLRYRKFNQRYAKWALDLEHPTLPIVDMSQDAITSTLLEQQRVNVVQ